MTDDAKHIVNGSLRHPLALAITHKVKQGRVGKGLRRYAFRSPLPTPELPAEPVNRIVKGDVNDFENKAIVFPTPKKENKLSRGRHGAQRCKISSKILNRK